MNSVIENEQTIRPVIFISLLIIFALAEAMFPLAKRKSSIIRQWSTNLALVLLSNLFLKLTLPILAVGVAHWAQSNGIGLFNYFSFFSHENMTVFTIILAIVLMDLIIYWQHVFMHNVPLLWRMHQVHHTEAGLDVSSAIRFHPLEMLFSMFIKMLFVVLLGVPVVAVILFEIILNASAMFNHSNLKLPKKLDSVLRKVIVTPEVHWVHHSQIVRETNSNYGFSLIFWDKLFSTYISRPKQDYPVLLQGLKQFNHQQPLNAVNLLLIPFKVKQ